MRKILIIIILSGCISKSTKTEIKNIINVEHPNLEQMIKKNLVQVVDTTKGSWGWDIEVSKMRNEYKVIYGFKPEKVPHEELVRELSSKLTKKITMGYFTYKVYPKNKRLGVKFLVNRKTKKVRAIR